MAEKTLQKVEEDLNCLVCLDIYTDPKLLQCHHVFCKECLKRLVQRNQQKQLFLMCPECRKVTLVPPEGVAGLQAAFHINHLLDILKEHKKATGDARYCPEHPTRELESFCETCHKLICLECAVVQHQSHKCDLVRNLFEICTKEIESSLNPVKSCFQVTDKALDRLIERDEEILGQQSSIEEEICEQTRLIHEAAEARKVELIHKLHQITGDKRQDLASQREKMEITIAQLRNYLDTVQKSLETSSQGEVVKMKTSVKQQAKVLTDSFQPDTLKLETEADVKVVTTSNAAELFKSYLNVLVAGSPDSAQCLATGNGLEVATVGEKFTVLLQAIDYESKPCKKMIQSLECELVSELTGKKVSGNVQRSGQSQYEISYQPTIKGRHLLHIKISGQHIRGSPFIVKVKLPVEKLGFPLQTYEVGGPFGIAVNTEGELIISNAHHSITIFGPSGTKPKSFGSKGSRLGEFDHPLGVTTDGIGNILVADRENCRIQRFSPDGQFLRSVDGKENKLLQFDTLGDITFNSSNGKIYVVNGNSVQILNFDLSFSSAFGKRGSSKGQFSDPNGIACDSTGNVYVADTDNHRIQVFTAEGKFLKTFGSTGNQKISPFRIAVDASNMVYVTEPYKHSISVFTCEGQLVTSFSTRLRGEKKTEFGPSGIAVDQHGRVCVCDAGADKVKIF